MLTYKKNLIEKARAFAIKAHGNQLYGLLPYSFHLEKVVEILVAHFPFYSETMIAAAWLHDTKEDTDVTLMDIRQEFGGHVTRIVDYCSDVPGKNRKERKQKTNEKLAHAPMVAKAVKLADRIANMQASIENPDKAKMYRDEFPGFMRAINTNQAHPQMFCLTIIAYKLFTDSTEAYNNRGKVKC